MNTDVNDNIRMKREMTRWIKQFAFMKDTDFDDLDMTNFIVIQKIAYNYVEKSKLETKTAEKIIEIVHWYDTSFELEPS